MWDLKCNFMRFSHPFLQRPETETGGEGGKSSLGSAAAILDSVGRHLGLFGTCTRKKVEERRKRNGSGKGWKLLESFFAAIWAAGETYRALLLHKDKMHKNIQFFVIFSVWNYFSTVYQSLIGKQGGEKWKGLFITFSHCAMIALLFQLGRIQLFGPILEKIDLVSLALYAIF